MINASSLSRAMTLGVDSILALPCDWSALRIVVIVRPSSTTPQPKVEPGTCASAPAKSRTPISVELLSSGRRACAMPALRACCAELVLMLLPYTPESLAKSHCSPSSRPSTISISTIMASTSTCARRISSRPITDSSAAISSVSAVIIRLLVDASASIVDFAAFADRLWPRLSSSSRAKFCMTRVSTSATSVASAYSRYLTRTLPLCSSGISR